jgi:hypothetical protein
MACFGAALLAATRFKGDCINEQLLQPVLRTKEGQSGAAHTVVNHLVLEMQSVQVAEARPGERLNHSGTPSNRMR